MSVVFSLPQELVDRILEEFTPHPPDIDEVANKALLACTLVNKSFRASAQRVLLSDIAIYNRTSQIASLQSALHSFPELWGCIRSIRIYLSHKNRDPQQLHDFLVFIQASAINNEQLSIRHDYKRLLGIPSFDSFSPELQHSILQLGTSSHFTTLHLKSIYISPSAIAQVPILQTLIFEQCSLSASESIPRGAYANVEVLHIIRCTNFFAGRFLNVIGRQLAFCDLKTLRYVFDRQTGTLLLRNFLNEFGADINLESIELVDEKGSNKSRSAILALEGVDLSKLAKLKHFRLQSFIAHPGVDASDETLISIVPHLLVPPSLKGPTTLEFIQVSLHALLIPMSGTTADAANTWPLVDLLQDSADWEKLDSTLADIKLYPSLRAFNFSLHLKPKAEDRHDAMEVVQYFTTRFPLCFPLLTSSQSVMHNAHVVVE